MELGMALAMAKMATVKVKVTELVMVTVK